jgi:TPR repeat protein
MKISRMILIGATLPFALFSDASSKPSVEAEESYLRGLQCVEGDGAVKDYAAAARFYREAAEAGYAPAQYDLGFLYEKGWGAALDLKDAAVWYRKAAEQGDAEAVRWYRAATEQDDLEATSNLAMMYLQGRGTPGDLEQAFGLFQKAAEQGYAVAQNNLALMYANGQAVARDFSRGPTYGSISLPRSFPDARSCET